MNNKVLLYDADTNEKMYITDFLGNRGLTMSKYSIIDLNGDSSPEVVGWLSRGANDYWGFLVLHYQDNMVYAYELAYRAFNELKSDGTFRFSSSVSDYGIGRIEFTSGTYKVNETAYSEIEYGTQKISYYIDNHSVSKEDFEEYIAEQCEKLDVECNYDGFNFGIVHRLFSRYQLLSKFNCQLSLIALAYVQKSHYRKASVMTFFLNTSEQHRSLPGVHFFIRKDTFVTETFSLIYKINANLFCNNSL